MTIVKSADDWRRTINVISFLKNVIKFHVPNLLPKIVKDNVTLLMKWINYLKDYLNFPNLWFVILWNKSPRRFFRKLSNILLCYMLCKNGEKWLLLMWLWDNYAVYLNNLIERSFGRVKFWETFVINDIFVITAILQAKSSKQAKTTFYQISVWSPTWLELLEHCRKQ